MGQGTEKMVKGQDDDERKHVVTLGCSKCHYKGQKCDSGFPEVCQHPTEGKKDLEHPGAFNPHTGGPQLGLMLPRDKPVRLSAEFSLFT